MYIQRNDPKSFQRVMLASPKKLTLPCPAVIVPFYFPEAMLGFDPATQEIIDHATGHRPPRWALEEGYAFLDIWLR